MSRSELQNRLKQIRKENNYTLDDIERLTGIKRGTYNNYENGNTEPKLETWKKLAVFFDVSVPYLQGIQENPLINKKYSLHSKVAPVLIREPHFNYGIKKVDYVHQINRTIKEVYSLGQKAISGDKKAQNILNDIDKIISNNSTDISKTPVNSSIRKNTNTSNGIDSSLAGTVDMNNLKNQLGGTSLGFKPLGLTFKKSTKTDYDVIHKKEK